MEVLEPTAQDKPKVSVALATWNGARYLRVQFDSFFAQSRRPDEIVCVDDASADHTLEILQEFALGSPSVVRVLHNPSNLGYVQAFSRALQECRGEFVFLSDQDDFWCPEKVSSVVDFFTSTPRALLVIHDLLFCDSNLNPSDVTKLGRLKELGLSEMAYVNGMATAVRSDFLRLCLPVPADPSLTHDLWLHSCAEFLGGRYVFEKVLAHYRRHANTVTGAGALNKVTTSRLGFAFHMLRGSITDDVSLHTHLDHLLDWALRKKSFIVRNGYMDADDFERSLSALRCKVAAVEIRRKLRACPRLSRVFRVIGFYIQGGYSSFSGWRSACRDLLVH